MYNPKFKALVMVVALVMALGIAPALAEKQDTAYIMFADGSWACQWWHDDNDYGGVIANEALVTGAGDYTVGLDFTKTASGQANGLAFMALGIAEGESTFPNHYLRINDIRVNGESIEFEKGYTSSDDGKCTRTNIYNEWVADLPEDARSYDGYIDDTNWMVVDPADFAEVKTIEIDFSLIKDALDVAYIMFADGAWGCQWWHDDNDYGGVKATEAVITGAGDYTVGLDFTATANGQASGLAFTALGIAHGEQTYPGYFIKINDIRLNGESIPFEKGYTSSDDSVCTRMNVFNEWVSALPDDARSFDGELEGATWMIVDKAAFESVKTYEIDFSLVPVTETAYLMFADGAWASQWWHDDNDYGGVKALEATVDGAGVYTVGLDFTGTQVGEANGLSFAAIGVEGGENSFSGYFIDVLSIKLNGNEISFGKGYTTTDDGVTTRLNLFNEWVSDIPAEARRADGDLEGASSIVIDKALFTGVKTLEVTFEYVYGKPIIKDAAAPLTAEEANELLMVDYNAYIGVQSQNYIFRNAWYDTYGRDDAENPGFFGRLTGWDADSNAVDYGGVLTDQVLSKDGEYTVSLTTGDMGFGTDASFNLLFVSTDIPSKLVKDGYLTISDVRVRFGGAATREYTEISTRDQYVRIVLLDSYNQSSEPFGYTVPGANEEISITFNVTGLID